MSEMVEKVAAKMEERRRELIAQPLRMIWPELARAAMEAMRDPTDGMEDAGLGDFDIYWGYTADGRPSGPKDVYRAMIDAALKDGATDE